MAYFALEQPGSWKRGRGGPRRSRGSRGTGQNWRGGVNPRTRIEDGEDSQGYSDNFERENQRFPHRGRGKRRL